MRSWITTHRAFLVASLSTFLVLGAGAVLWRLYGRGIVEDVYRGESLEILNRLIERPPARRLHGYVNRTNRLVGEILTGAIALYALAALLYFALRSRARARWALLALALVALCAGVFGQTLGFDFVGFDDDDYLFEHPQVARGLTLENARWALSTGAMSNWHPLTWISHMLDVEIFGLAPGGHHATSILLHALNAALLFALLQSLTKFLQALLF